MSCPRRVLALSFLAYAMIVCGLWAYDGLYAGFYAETALIYLSETRDWLTGFFYVDPLRQFTSVFYHVSYLIGEALGQQGSYVPYQIVYALLWFGRAAFVFLIVRELFPERPLLACLAGLLVAMHTGDLSLNWIGQLNQHGFIFCMTAGFYAYVRALKSRTWWISLAWAGAAAFGFYLSLWAYESPLPVIPAFVVVALVLVWPRLPQAAIATALAAVPVTSFLWLSVQRYLGSEGAATYQVVILRSDFAPSALASDLLFHVKQSVAFWHWPHTAWAWDTSHMLAFVAITVAVLLCVPIAAKADKGQDIDRRFVLFALGALALVTASYLVPILIGNNRNLWRTEFLASVPAGMLMAAVLYAATTYIPRLYPRVAIIASALLTVGIFSAAAGATSARHREYWEQARTMMASLLEQLPRVKDGTLFVMHGTPKDALVFGENQWFDLALKLAYPGTKVGGAFYFEDGSPAPGVGSSTAEHVVNLSFDKVSGRVRVDSVPCGAVTPGPIPDIAVRRYGPVGAPADMHCRQALGWLRARTAHEAQGPINAVIWSAPLGRYHDFP